MLDYSLFGVEDDAPKLNNIDTRATADRLLKLLDLTIGTAEGAVVPFDLAFALQQIENVALQLREAQRFRGLSTRAR
jgi:hypothetical protein